MKSGALVRARHEWAQNPRLRWGALVVLAFVGAHVAMGLMDDRKAVAADFQRDAELYRRLDATARERAWPERARRAEGLRDAQLASLPAVRGDGAARADLQAWLTQVAADAGLQQPVVAMETVVDVPGHPDLRQAVGRLEGGVATLHEAQPALRALAAGLPWVQVEQLQLEAVAPVRLRAIVRAYYRRGTRSVSPGRSEPIADSGDAPAAGATIGAPAGPTPAVDRTQAETGR